MTGPGERAGSAPKSAPPRLKPQGVWAGSAGCTTALGLAPTRVWKNACAGKRSLGWWGSLRPSNGRPVTGLMARLG
jgi:hypothetical protein